MGFLKNLFGGTSPELSENMDEFLILEGDDDLEVVGESYRQDDLWKLIGGKSSERVRIDILACLIPEPQNNYDPNAIGVWIGGVQVGYIAKELAREIIDDLNRLIKENSNRFMTLRGVIAGGGNRDDGPGMLGVFLEFSAEQFGLNSNAQSSNVVPAFTMSTGQTDAFFTDQQDDTYDLSWMIDLSQDPTKRIVGLREVLENNHEPISRHFAFSELEEILYHYRDIFPEALSQYDEIAEKHQSELETTIRAAMMIKWNKLPNLVVHRQSAIRHTKSKNYLKALEWAERGLEVYGPDSFREEWVLDLQKRVFSLRTKVAKADASKKA